MPSSSAPVDPEKLGHPVALTRDSEDGPATKPANRSAVETSRKVSFAAEENAISELSTQDKAASANDGLFSVPDFTQPAEQREEEVVSPSEAGPSALIDGLQKSVV
jgi:hypothetical protein